MEGSLVAYKVFTNGSVLNASEMNEYLMNQSVITFTNSTARGSAITTPLEGMITYLEDTDGYEFWNGTAWTALGSGGIWQSYTPTYTGFTLGNGTAVFRYAKIGKTVIVQGTITFGSTTSVTNFIASLPSTSATAQYGTNAVIGEFSALDDGINSYHGFVRWHSSTEFRPRTMNPVSSTGPIVSGTVSATSPFTWGTGDVMNFSFIYEEA
jgi:hypothetical protein